MMNGRFSVFIAESLILVVVCSAPANSHSENAILLDYFSGDAVYTD